MPHVICIFFVAGSCKRFFVVFHERLGNSFILYGRLPSFVFHKLSPRTAKSNVLIVYLQWISTWNFYIWSKWNCFAYLLLITYNTYYVDAVTPLHYISAIKLIIYVFNHNRYRSCYLQCLRIISHFLQPCFTCFSTIYGI